MRIRIAANALSLAGGAVFVFAVGWPTFALIIRAVSDGVAPETGFGFSARQWILLGRSVELSLAGTAISLVLSIPVAAVLGSHGRWVCSPLPIVLCGVLLFCPPMVYAFGWEMLLPTSLDGSVRCVGTWALWAWPIPAALIGLSWARSGRRSYEAAVLSASRSRAFLRVALPGLLKIAGLACLCVFLLCMGDYSVPHACGLSVFATELLALASTSPNVIDVAWPAGLTVAVAAVGLAAVLLIGSHSGAAVAGAVIRGDSQRRPIMPLAVMFVAAVVSLGLPISGLLSRLDSVAWFGTAIQTYGSDAAWSLFTALLAGVLAVGMGVTLAPLRRVSLVCLLWALVLGATPGALVGVAMVAAFDLPAFEFLYQHWPILTLCYLARFGWVGLLAGRIARRSTGRKVIEQSEIDGADGLAKWRLVELPTHWPTLACGVWIVGCLSLADTSASSLVRIPAFNPIAHVLIEKFHRFEDGMLVAISLLLLLAAVPGAILFGVAFSRESRR